MSVPYSDNLYSALDDSDDDQQDALSPADGYFHASSSSDVASSSHPQPDPDSQRYPSYPSVPAVPNVLVEDPTLREQDATAKAREAEEERRLNTQHASSPAAPQPQPSSLPGHHHRRSVEDDDHFAYAGHSRQHSSPSTAPPLQTRPVFQSTPSDAPPAYSPRSPTDPTSPQSPEGGYQTFGPSAGSSQQPTMGVPEEQQRLLPRAPESMGGAQGGQGGSWWQRLKDLCSVGNLRGKLRTILGVLLLLSIFIIVLSSFTIRPNHDNHGNNKSPGVKDPTPIKKPDLSHGDLRWSNLKMCQNNPQHSTKITYNVGFDAGRKLTIFEKIDDDDDDNLHNGREPHVTGTLILRPSDNRAGQLDVEVISNHKDLTVEADWDTDDQSIKIIIPRSVNWSGGKLPCIQIRITVWVPSNAGLDRLEAEITHLDIDVLEGLDLGIEGKTFLTTIVGDISTPKPSNDVLPYKLASREIWVQTVSGDINGWYPLYDLLNIATASGEVTTDVSPKTAYSKEPKSAVLEVSSISGDLTIKEPLDAAIGPKKVESIPARDYVVKIESASGDIETNLAVSSSAKFATHSGDMTLRLWPVLDSELLGLGVSTVLPAPSIMTETKSGDLNLDLLEPRWTKLKGLEGDNRLEAPGDGDDKDHEDKDKDGPFLIIHPHSNLNDMSQTSPAGDSPPLSSLNSKHSSISGRMQLRYPSSWTGRLEAQTLSGGQKIRGKGLDTWKKTGSFPRIIEGTKGPGKSHLSVETISGDQDVLVGEE